MPPKTKTKKSKKKPTKSKVTTASKTKSVKNKSKKKIAVKRTISKAKTAKKAMKTHPAKKKVAKIRRKGRSLEPVAFSVKRPGARSGRQSGDLQGLSRRAAADSESVAELVEEGSIFEAEVVLGVEAGADEQEVRTHEVPEDDVPGEYLDED